MRSRVVSFRVPDDLYEEFERKCKDEGASPAIRLREFVESICHPVKVNKVNTDNKARVKVINVEVEKVGKVIEEGIQDSSQAANGRKR